MKFTRLGVEGAFLVELERLGDSRGYFARAWCEREFAAAGIRAEFVQTNISRTAERGTIRGFHYQLPPHSEAKLVRCVRGRIYYVIVDLRPDSPSFRRWVGQELSSESGNAIYLPRGIATGMQALTDGAEMLYRVTSSYAPGSERGFRYDDEAFRIDWPLPPALVSEKDLSWPPFEPCEELRGLVQD